MTSIEWCDESWNPVVGCTRVSSGCDNCYAMGVAHRQLAPQHKGLTKLRPKGSSKPGVDWNGVVRCVPNQLAKPMHWKKPRRIFVNSMSDLFHTAVPFEFIAKVFAVMASCPRHTFMVLTKRPACALAWYRWQEDLAANDPSAILWPERARERDRLGEPGLGGRPPRELAFYSAYPKWPLPNVHLGVSTEDQSTFDQRVPLLLQCPASVRWISAEPLLGMIDLEYGLDPRERDVDRAWPEVPRVARLDWVVVGGESGPGARPCIVPDVRHIVQQCTWNDVPVFVKQLGRRPIGLDLDSPDAKLAHRKGSDPTEWPEDLRIRQLPGQT